MPSGMQPLAYQAYPLTRSMAGLTRGHRLQGRVSNGPCSSSSRHSRTRTKVGGACESSRVSASPLLSRVHMRNDTTPPEHADQIHVAPTKQPAKAWRRIRASARMLASLLLGGAMVLGAIAVFRQGLLPLID